MIASVTKEDLAVATGSESMPILDIHCSTCADCFDVVTYLFRTTGQVLGVSLSGALLQSILAAKLRERIHGPGAFEVSTTLIFGAPVPHLRLDYREHTVWHA